ncbi:hypothetical protein F4778DRAFT_781657 [Xylariomycetidae sp. FL2044]|nr:hypothetical protein F4778DRAFT_781657 [Xylariomycetidae sp. FL2044]
MPSVKNPNGPSKNRLAARTAKARKQSTKGRTTSKQSKIANADARRGARAGILPTSGPNRALSSKKKRKLEKQMAHALKRKMEAEGEVEMKDAPEETETNRSKNEEARSADEEMAVDADGIS